MGVKRQAHFSGFARFELEHSSAEWVTLDFATELAERGFPRALHVRDVEAGRELHGMNRVGTHTVGFVGHQNWRQAAHV